MSFTCTTQVSVKTVEVFDTVFIQYNEKRLKDALIGRSRSDSTLRSSYCLPFSPLRQSTEDDYSLSKTSLHSRAEITFILQNKVQHAILKKMKKTLVMLQPVAHTVILSCSLNGRKHACFSGTAEKIRVK